MRGKPVASLGVPGRTGSAEMEIVIHGHAQTAAVSSRISKVARTSTASLHTACPTGFGLRTVLKIGKRAKSMASSGRNILRDMKSAVRGSTR